MSNKLFKVQSSRLTQSIALPFELPRTLHLEP